MDISNDKIRNVLQNFTGVANRQELIAENKGVEYINDTTATMPEAVIFAIRATKQRFPKSEIILILGGQDKNLYFRNLAAEINTELKKIVLLPGTASDIIKNELSAMGSKIKIIPAPSMQEAVKKAEGISKRGDVVILSPGAASFNLFKNEFDRGEQFVKAVKSLR